MWTRLNFFVGAWQGSGQGKSGDSRVERKYEFICEPRGNVNVNGKGEMDLWLVTSAKETS